MGRGQRKGKLTLDDDGDHDVQPVLQSAELLDDGAGTGTNAAIADGDPDSYAEISGYPKSISSASIHTFRKPEPNLAAQHPVEHRAPHRATNAFPQIEGVARPRQATTYYKQHTRKASVPTSASTPISTTRMPHASTQKHNPPQQVNA